MASSQINLTRIALIGHMGAGKTSVGRLLAPKISFAFKDSDAEIVEKNQNTIAAIFAKEGESGFRKYEEEVITQLVKEPQTVISTGGGVVTNHKLRSLLKQTCTVFYLAIDIRTQMGRVKKSNSRPLLKKNNLEETLQKIHAQRNNLYRETAHHIINVNNKSINHIVKEIIGLIP